MRIENLKHGFTLLEVLISIMLLSLVLMALYRSADILRNSNKNLFHHLERSSDSIKGAKVLYIDLLQADGNITIENRDKNFYRVIIYNTKHSLHGLYSAKVVWLVYKENKTLLRLEGIDFNLPLKEDNRVETDVISKNIELFTVYKSKKRDKILFIIKSVGKEAQSFMIQQISKTRPKLKLVNPSTLGRGNQNSKQNRYVPAKI